MLKHLRGTIGAAFRLAITTLRATNDPMYALRGALLKLNVQHRPPITDEAQLGALTRENYRVMREELLKIVYWTPDNPEGIPKPLDSQFARSS